jgi:outer membrane protein insertion porin family
MRWIPLALMTLSAPALADDPPAPVGDSLEAARERAREEGVLKAAKPLKDKVYEIRVEGARKTEPDAVLVQVRSRTGQAPNQQTIQEDVRRIFRMGLFSDVVVRAQKGPKGSIVLVFVLAEKPALAKIVLEGNSDVSDEDLKEVIDLKPYQVLDIKRVRKNVTKLEKLYVDKGFFLADVDYEIRKSDGEVDKNDDVPGLFDGIDGAPQPISDLQGPDPTEGEFVDVVFVVNERAKVKVESINFVGNTSISADELKQVLATKENHPLGVMTDWGTYKEENAEIDLLTIDAIYQDKGFLNVNVGKPRVSLSQDKTRMSMVIPITEGEQHFLGSLDIQGDLLVDTREIADKVRADDPQAIVFSKDQLLGRVDIAPGDIFSRNQLARDVLAIADRYRDEGYAYVNILPDFRVQVDEETGKHMVALLLRVQAGPRVRVERIEITGNTKTQDRVIRREMRLYEGEFYSASSQRVSEQRVRALGFFEDVKVTTKQGGGDDRMVLVIDVREKPTGTFQLGAGFSNAEQFIFTGQVAQNNFLGRGLTLSGSIQWSAFRNIVDFRYIDPYLFYIGQEPITFATSLFNTQRNFIDFFRNSTGGDITLGYAIGRPFAHLTRPLQKNAKPGALPYIPDFENLQLFLTYSGERVEIQESTFNVNLVGLSANVPRYTTSLRASLLFDQRNNRIFPSKGWFLQAQAELADPLLGSGLLPGTETGLKGLLKGVNPTGDGLGFLKSSGRPNAFTRLGVVARGYYSFDDLLPLKGVVLKANADLGLLVTDDPTLIFEHYFLGGFNTIRGYTPRSLGPVERVGSLDPTNGLEEFRIGGDKQFFFNLELEFPILEQVGIRGVVFFDAGNAYGADENLFYLGNGPTEFLAGADCGGQKCFDPRTDLGPLGLFKSIGFGVRWFSPIGPLRFEWGVPLNARPIGTLGLRQGDIPLLFEFNIGNSF